jgi:hypothetical protein
MAHKFQGMNVKRKLIREKIEYTFFFFGKKIEYTLRGPMSEN